jgi:prevent-host-death family protein
MDRVGIKDLKAGLSSYVARARIGERIVITDHGEEVAMIVPISKERSLVTSFVKSGRAQWLGGKPKGLKGIVIKGPPLSETIMEERS